MEELYDPEGDDEAETQHFNDVAERILTKGGPAHPRELYGWIRSQLPAAFDGASYERPSGWAGSYIPENLEEHHPEAAAAATADQSARGLGVAPMCAA